jgi:hypothetical protein
MSKGPNLIVGPYVSPNMDHDKDMAENGANPRLAKGVYVVIAIALIALVVLVGVGLHIPTGG